jgi:hypothetical protein
LPSYLFSVEKERHFVRQPKEIVSLSYFSTVEKRNVKRTKVDWERKQQVIIIIIIIQISSVSIYLLKNLIVMGPVTKLAGVN